MIRPQHLGQRLSALVDGELGHQERDRALAHIAHCPACRSQLEEERRVKDRLAAPTPPASPALTARLLGLAEPGEPMPPRERRMPLAPVVPTLPAPGRGRGLTRPGGRTDPRRPGRVRASTSRSRRARYTAAAAVSAVGLVLGAAFMAGGPPQQQPGAPVLPPAAELSVEHAATTSGQPLGDPAFDAVTASVGGLYFAPRATGR